LHYQDANILVQGVVGPVAVFERNSDLLIPKRGLSGFWHLFTKTWEEPEVVKIRTKFVVLFSSDIEQCPKQIVRLYHLRFQIEFLFRDSKQFIGLEDRQSRTAKKLDFHFNSSLRALNLAKLQAWQHRDPNQPFIFSMASFKRHALNDFLLDTFISRLALSPDVIKSHPNYEALRSYGVIAT
jgi:hypothetical protein